MNPLATLLDNLGLTLADLDKKTSNERLTFQDQLRRLMANRKRSLAVGDQNASSRGLLQSGIALKQQVDTNTQFDDAQGAATADFNSRLAGIASQRLQAEAQYNLKKAELEAAATADAQPNALAALGAPAPLAAPAIPKQEPVNVTPKPKGTSQSFKNTVVKRVVKPTKPPVGSNPLKVGVM